jgi:transcriptional regulator with XRE-family HTH domain
VPKTKKNAVDAHIGNYLRLLRRSRGMSQAELGEALGVTYQQIQKYESGGNRMTVSTLLTLAQLFGVTPKYFFECIANVVQLSEPGNILDVDAVSYTMSAEGRALLRAFLAIKQPALRRRLIALIESMATQPRTGKDQ